MKQDIDNIILDGIQSRYSKNDKLDYIPGMASSKNICMIKGTILVSYPNWEVIKQLE